MNFQGLTKIETADKYLDIAFGAASKKADQARQKTIKFKIKKSQYVESRRVGAVAITLTRHFGKIIEAFPRTEGLPDFYVEMIKATMDIALLKKSFGAVNWVNGQLKKLSGQYESKISRCQHHLNIGLYRKEFYGRVSSMLKQIKNELLYLEKARKIMREFPSIKQNIFTVAICGFPNIGKTTLLSKLTDADPEISDYSFTTKGINVGYIRDENKKRIAQVLDTPGTLNRFEKMNAIEKQAYIAMTYAAQKYIYVIDLTETYPLADQMKMLKMIAKDKKEIFIYFSKTDLLEKGEVECFTNEHNLSNIKTFDELKEVLISHKEK